MRLFLVYFLSVFFCVMDGQSQEKLLNIETRDKLFEKGIDFYFKKDISSLKKVSKETLKMFKEFNDSISLAKHFHFKALLSKLNYSTDSAFYFYYKSKEISKSLKDSLEVGRRLLSIANLQREARDYLGSEISSIEALQYLEPINSYRYIVNLYNNLGLVSANLGQEEPALEYYNSAIKVNSLIEDKRRKERAYLHVINNIGLLHQTKSNHKEAIKFFNKGLEFDSIKQKYPLHYALLLENLTFSNVELNKKRYAVDYFNEVIHIREKEQDLSNLSITHNLLSGYFLKDNNISKARYHAIEALKYAKQTNNNRRWLEALQILADLTSGNESKAYLEEYIILNDSLFQQERQLKNQFAKIRYETEKTEKENADLKIENEKTLAEAEAQKQRATIGLLLSGISIMFLLSSISFFRFRRKKLLFLTQLQKIEAREQERRQIAKSLHDEVAGDLRLLHRKLEKSLLLEEAQKLELVKDNVRNLSHQLSSVSFEEVPFRDQVINLVSDYFSPEFIIKVNGLKEIDWSQANNSIKRMLYLSLRECIQNCQKYAEASKMTISFSIHKKSVLLDVVDNGKGFDTATQKKGIGLLNLQERVQELNGTLTIESEIGKGTHIIIQTPLNV